MHIVMLKNVQPDVLGLLPFMLDENDPRPAREQFDENYSHGGGWRPMKGFELTGNGAMSLRYPGDPVMHPIAMIWLRDEQILFYPHAFVMIYRSKKDFEVARMD